MDETGVAPAAEPLPDAPRSGLARLRRRRVFVEDERDDGRYLRLTWHREKHVFVLSTWVEDVCTGSVRVPVEQAPELIGLLVDGLGDAVSHPRGVGSEAEAPPGLSDRVLGWLGLRRTRRPKARRKPDKPTSATILQLHRTS